MLESFLNLNANVSAVFGFSIVGGITIMAKSVIKAYKANKTANDERNAIMSSEIEMLKESNRAILHGQLFDLCVAYIKRGYIKPIELRNLNYLYKSYRNLNGNGTIEMLMNDVSLLTVKED